MRLSMPLSMSMLYHACRCLPLEGAPAPSCEHAMRLYTMSAASGMAAKDFGGKVVTSLHLLAHLVHSAYRVLTSSLDTGVYQFLAKRAEGAGNRFGRDGTPQTVRRQFRAGDKEGDGRPRTTEGPEQRAYRLSREAPTEGPEANQ